MKKEKCYYEDFSVCTCTMSPNCDNNCVGSECSCFISESDYFGKMMSGEIKEKAPSQEEEKLRRERINKNLSLGKTKKQLKHEAREEAKKNGVGTGYSLMDDPRFKDLFH